MKYSKQIILGIGIILFCGCSKKHKYKSCVTLDKPTANISEVITFHNCSDYDGGYTNARWSFGDGTTANSNDKESVQHSYSTAGTYQVTLYVGEKENQSEQTKSVTIQ